MVTFSLMRCQRTLKFQNLDMIAVSTTQRGQGKDNRFHDFVVVASKVVPILVKIHFKVANACRFE